jgi:hypothetical protein
MSRACAILALLLTVIAGCATSPPSRTAAEALRHDLRREELQASRYEEYLNFIQSIDAAELKQSNGYYDEAEKLYRLAVVKGLILKQPRHEPQGPLPVASAGTDYSLSQTEGLSPPADAAGEPAGRVPAPPESKEEMPSLQSELIVGGEGVYLVKKK